jgi:hypothetical protein
MSVTLTLSKAQLEAIKKQAAPAAPAQEGGKRKVKKSTKRPAKKTTKKTTKKTGKK